MNTYRLIAFQASDCGMRHTCQVKEFSRGAAERYLGLMPCMTADSVFEATHGAVVDTVISLYLYLPCWVDLLSYSERCLGFCVYLGHQQYLTQLNKIPDS